MSIDPSLKIRGALTRQRNVLTRDERIKILKDQDRWEEGQPVLGLPKTSGKKK